MNCIISKIEYINSAVVYKPIGYSTDETFCASINADYDSTLGSWITTNQADLEAEILSISVFFTTTPIVYVARTIVTSLEGLNEITEL